ncbi:MAG: hypothetical protein R2844_10910 [Caldilineales bacterium]
MIAFLTMLPGGFVKNMGLSLWIAIPATLVLGAALGSINGGLVAYLRIPAFIATLATLSAFKEPFAYDRGRLADLSAFPGVAQPILWHVLGPALAVHLRGGALCHIRGAGALEGGT